MAIATVLKTVVRKDLWVRIPRPPLFRSTLAAIAPALVSSRVSAQRVMPIANARSDMPLGPMLEMGSMSKSTHEPEVFSGPAVGGAAGLGGPVKLAASVGFGI